MKFRPCIDLHGGKVKQIVGATLSDQDQGGLTTNFISEFSPAYYAAMYRRDRLEGGHVIMLGSGNEEGATAALTAYPGGLQLGGGITPANAGLWLDRGAAGVILTSYVFHDGRINEAHLKKIVATVGRDRLILDLSCRKKGNDYYIVTDRWQRFTDVVISPAVLDYFAGFCCEFLIHAVDVEGKCGGIDATLAFNLGNWVTIPTTYAGGVRSLEDLQQLKDLGQGRLDATIGSALDIFGGQGVKYGDAVAFNQNAGSDEIE